MITERMNNLPKIVFSRTLKSPEWNNSRVVSENIAEAVAKLKAEPGKDLADSGERQHRPDVHQPRHDR